MQRSFIQAEVVTRQAEIRGTKKAKRIPSPSPKPKIRGSEVQRGRQEAWGSWSRSKVKKKQESDGRINRRTRQTQKNQKQRGVVWISNKLAYKQSAQSKWSTFWRLVIVQTEVYIQGGLNRLGRVRGCEELLHNLCKRKHMGKIGQWPGLTRNTDWNHIRQPKHSARLQLRSNKCW